MLLPECLSSAYTKLRDNIDLSKARVIRSSELIPIYVGIEGPLEGSIIWNFQVKRTNASPRFRASLALGTLKQTFCIQQGTGETIEDYCPASHTRHHAGEAYRGPAMDG